MTLILTIGIPASGKSTFITKFPKENIISTDQIREEVFGDVAFQSPKVFDVVYERLEKCLREDKICILDATNLRKRYRKVPIAMAKKYNHKVKGIVFDVPLSVAKERNRNRDRFVPEFVLDRMHKGFEFPEYSEGFDVIETKSFK